jgi:hypothetical protein
MSNNPFDKNRLPEQGQETDDPRKTDWDKDPGKPQRKGESMARKQQGQKFVSDEDIVRNRRPA